MTACIRYFEELLAEPLRKLKLYVSSHGTDGDGRYFAAQKVNMTGDPTWASGNATSHWAIFPNGAIEFRIDHEGFTLRALLLDDGRVINIEFQAAISSGGRRGAGEGG